MNGDYQGSLFERNNDGAKLNQKSKITSEEYVEDLEDHMPGAMPIQTISNQVSNQTLLNGNLSKHSQQRVPAKNGYVQHVNGRPNFRSMLEDAEIDSHI